MARRRQRPQNYNTKPEWDATKIKALRVHLGYTQQRLSEELGTRQQTISEWETGQYRPRGATVTLLNIIAERVGFVYEPDSDGDTSQVNAGKSDAAGHQAADE